MANEKQIDLSLVIRAVDKATGPIKEIRERIEKRLAPLKDATKAFQANIGFEGIAKKWGAVKDAAGGVGQEIATLGARLAGLAVGAGVAFWTIFHGAMEAGDQLATVSQRVGLNVDSFASLQYAAKQADIDAEGFVSAMDKFNKNMGELHVGDGGGFMKFLNEISPTFGRQMKAAKSNEAALSLLTDAFAKIEDPARRAILATTVFGKSGAQMGVFLSQGGAAIQAQQRRYMDLVGSQENSAQAASDLDNATKDLQTAFYGLHMTFAGAFFPTLTKLAAKLTEYFSGHRNGLKEWADKAAAAFDTWLSGGGLERLIGSLERIAGAIGSVVEWLGPMGSAFAGAGVLLAPLLASLASLTVSVVSLGAELLPIFAAAWAAVAPAVTAAAAPLLGVLGTVASLSLAFLPFLAAAAGVALAGKAIADNWGDLTFIFKDWGNSIRNVFRDAWEEIQPIIDAISGFASHPFESLEGVVRHVGDTAIPPRPAGVPPAPGASSTQANVTVDFSNLPRGARVSSPTGDAPVTVSAGYTMAAP
jgi:hypothetical protein